MAHVPMVQIVNAEVPTVEQLVIVVAVMHILEETIYAMVRNL